MAVAYGYTIRAGSRLVAPWRRYILFFPEGVHVYAFVESWSVAEGVLHCQVGFTPWSLRS